MALIVHKYGGTSMGSTERIRNVAKRVAKWARAGHQMVVVPSAMSGETNRLLALAKEVQPAQLTAESLRELDAIAANGALRVRGNAQQGGVAAWIEPQYVTGLPVNYLEIALRAEQRRREVEELIKRNEVAVGMSLEEVTRSLGKPQKRSSRTGREGSTQTYEYIKYKLIPQTVYTPAYVQSITGIRPDPRQRLETVTVRGGYGYDASTVYVKVPVGTVTVGFVNGLVETVEESEGTLTGANAAIVVPPVDLGWW